MGSTSSLSHRALSATGSHIHNRGLTHTIGALLASTTSQGHKRTYLTETDGIVCNPNRLSIRWISWLGWLNKLVLFSESRLKTNKPSTQCNVLTFCWALWFKRGVRIQTCRDTTVYVWCVVRLVTIPMELLLYVNRNEGMKVCYLKLVWPSSYEIRKFKVLTLKFTFLPCTGSSFPCVL